MHTFKVIAPDGQILGSARLWFVGRSEKMPEVRLVYVPELMLNGSFAREAPGRGIARIFPDGSTVTRADFPAEGFVALHGSVLITPNGVSVQSLSGALLPESLRHFDVLAPSSIPLISESAGFARQMAADGHV